jgi:nucleoside phosphorylase
MTTKIRLTADTYTVGLIYVKPLEMHAIYVMLNEQREPIPMRVEDDNEYTLGKIGNHNVAIAGPPRGSQGKVAIENVVSRIRLAFKNIRVGLLVGIRGGAPHFLEHDVRLGDVVVGAPEVGLTVVQYDLGKQLPDGIKVTRLVNKPPELLLKVVDKVNDRYQRTSERTDDFFVHLKRFAEFPRMRGYYKRPSIPGRLFRSEYDHPNGTFCSTHDHCHEVKRPDRDSPHEARIHYSTILSGDLVMKSGLRRDQISAMHHNALCFEMEAAGLMDAFPCVVVRGICDCSDSHKSKGWREYTAAVAAAYAREILLTRAERVFHELKYPEIGKLVTSRTRRPS